MKLQLRLSLLLLCLMALTVPGWSATLDIVPFQTTNRAPMVEIFGLPTPGTAILLDSGQNAAELDLDTVQNFNHADKGDEILFMDGETYRLNLSLRRGIKPGFEAGIEIPYLWHRGGFLDDFIENWHDTFGMPQGGRDKYPQDQLRYSYIKNGKQEVLVDKNAQGLGDIRLRAAWQISRSEEGPPRGLALHASLKLPTGDSDDLLGSGSTDLALWLSGTHGSSWRDMGVALFGHLGLLGMTDGDVAEGQQNNLVGFAMLGGGWQPYSWLVLKLQFDTHTPFYDSDLRELGNVAGVLTVGGDVALGEHTALELGVAEDVITDTAPDVVFRLALRTRF